MLSKLLDSDQQFLIINEELKPIHYDPFKDEFIPCNELEDLSVHDFQYTDDHQLWFSSCKKPNFRVSIIKINEFLHEQHENPVQS